MQTTSYFIMLFSTIRAIMSKQSHFNNFYGVYYTRGKRGAGGHVPPWNFFVTLDHLFSPPLL